MFGLPAETIAVLVVIPSVWIIYTVGFLIISRDWHVADEEE